MVEGQAAPSFRAKERAPGKRPHPCRRRRRLRFRQNALSPTVPNDRRLSRWRARCAVRPDRMPCRPSRTISAPVRTSRADLRNRIPAADEARMEPPVATRSRSVPRRSRRRLGAIEPSRRAKCYRRRRSADRATARARACAPHPDSGCRPLRLDRRSVREPSQDARRSHRAVRLVRAWRSFARRYSRIGLRQIRRRDRLVARRHDFDANASPIDAVRNDPKRVGAILR